MVLGESEMYALTFTRHKPFWICLLLSSAWAAHSGNWTGQGSYGTVHKGRVKATGEIVAVKTIPLSGNGEQTVIQREINMLRECQHPNVVRYMVSLIFPPPEVEVGTLSGCDAVHGLHRSAGSLSSWL